MRAYIRARAILNEHEINFGKLVLYLPRAHSLNEVESHYFGNPNLGAFLRSVLQLPKVVFSIRHKIFHPYSKAIGVA